MRLLFDFFPILIFFISYKFFGIFAATAMAMAASALQVAVYWLKHRKFETLHLITLGMVLLLGGTTLWLHNDLFIKWKPTAIYGAFALTFLFSQFFGKKPLIQHLLASKIELPNKIWQHLNLSWVLFFILMSLTNIYVVYNYSTDVWVNFKLFGSLGLTLIFLIIQAAYMSKHLPKEPTVKSNNNHDK